MRARLRLGVRSRRLAFLLTVTLLAAGLVGAGTAVGQGGRPQNDPDQPKPGSERGGTNALKDCVTHHRTEGLYDAFVVLPILPKQLARDEEAEAAVQVINTWKQHLRGLSMNLRVQGNESILTVPGAASIVGQAKERDEFEFQGRYEYQTTGTPDNPQPIPLDLTFPVEPNATGLSVHLSLAFRDVFPNGTGTEREGRIEARLFGPQENVGTELHPRGFDGRRAEERNLTLNRSQVGLGGIGDWQLRMDFKAPGFPGNSADYLAVVVVTYQQGVQEQVFPIRTDPALVIAPGESALVPFRLKGIQMGSQTVVLDVRAEVYFKVGHQDKTTPDADNYTRIATRDIAVGTSFVGSDLRPVAAVTPGLDARLVGGEILGFASAALLVPSLLLGGTYGRRSRQILNAMLGGAKRRVMFHNLVSLGLVATTLVHIVLFSMEIRYTLLMGILWGGLASVCLLVLGLTGYYQVPLIQKFGFNWWKIVHLTFGLLVVVAVTYHLVADGADFFFLKDQLPDALNALNFAQK